MLTTHRTATPPDYLQAYLEYARALSAGEFDTADVLLARLAGKRMPADDAPAADRNGFRRVVADFIADLGWPTLPVDHDGAFGVDLAIIDPRTSLYGIGIECDTPRHRMLAHAHAREIWRRRVLEGTFPYVYRVLSKGWYDDRKKEQADLRHAIEEALGKRGLQ